MQWHRREDLLKYTGKRRKRTPDRGIRKGTQPPVEVRPLTEEEWANRRRP